MYVIYVSAINKYIYIYMYPINRSRSYCRKPVLQGTAGYYHIPSFLD